MSHDGISVFDGPNVDEPMVDARAAHNALLIPLRWINSKAARRARGVPHYRIGHLVRFRLGELEQWRDRHATVMVTAPEVVDAVVQPVSPLTMVEHFSDADWRSREPPRRSLPFRLLARIIMLNMGTIGCPIGAGHAC